MSVKSATLNLIKAIGDRITCTPQCLYSTAFTKQMLTIIL